MRPRDILAFLLWTAAAIGLGAILQAKFAPPSPITYRVEQAYKPATFSECKKLFKQHFRGTNYGSCKTACR